ncbi:hypothetical protein [Mediterraneibacter gnavus]|nr:hypothetical protein [Mediterraneibacter gnavus]
MLFGREVVVLDDDMIAGDGELKVLSVIRNHSAHFSTANRQALNG